MPRKTQTSGSNDAGTSGDETLLTKEQLRERLNLESTRMISQLVSRRKIPVIRLGHRTVRFHLPSVLAALARLEIKEIGRQ
ncbi:hypothetical protein ACXR0O_24980 [Verrucomicrobiota bacterium sgz303538]